MTAAGPRRRSDDRWDQRPGSVGSRIASLAVALLLGCACFPLALFALWPAHSVGEDGLGEALPEVVLLGLAGLGAVTAFRWALGAHGRSAVLLGRVLGLAPCLLVALELLRR